MTTQAQRVRSEAARLAHMRARIIAAWNAATPEDLAAGLAWYDRAATAAATMGDPIIAAGVIAALSPRNPWAQNLKWARDMMTASIEKGECPAVHTTVMRGQAWRIANGEHPLAVLNGPKVRAFFANITGDLDAVTVDVWAARVAEGRSDKNPPSGRRYALIARAYREAAAVIGESPRSVQAAVWVALRGAAD